jgi:toxin ParE1/3/4
MKVTFSKRAFGDIAAIVDYLSKESPAGAERVRVRIKEIARFLANYPYAGRAVGLKDIRVMPLDRYPYLLFFRVVPGKDEVRILRVRHAARQPVYLNDPPWEFAYR